MQPDELYLHAVSLLSHKDYSLREMRRVLRRCSDDATTIEGVIAHLLERDYLNDRRIAEKNVSRYLKRLYGPSLIRQELRQKGIPQDVIEQAINDSDVDWLQIAAQCRIINFGETPPSVPKEKARQMLFLQNHGFSMDMIISAITPSKG